MDSEYTHEKWQPPRINTRACFVVALALIMALLVSWRSGYMISLSSIGQFTAIEDHAYGSPLTLTSPTKWETWEFGSTHTIAWKGGNKDWPVSIYLVSENGAQLYRTLVDNTENDGEGPWIVDVPARRYRIQLEACAGCATGSAWDMDNGSLTVPATDGLQIEDAGYPANASLVVFSPTGGETIYRSSKQTIRWYGGKPDWELNLELVSVDSGKLPEIIVRGTANTGTYIWNVPSYITSGDYYLKISCTNCSIDAHGVIAYSFNYFTIKDR